MRLKKMMLLLAAIVLSMGLSVPAQASTFDWETITGYQTGGDANQYNWYYAYDIGFFNDTLMIDVDIKLTGEVNAMSLGADSGKYLKDIWEAGMESIWSTDRFYVPIVLNVDWVDTDPHHTVNVVAGEGRANTQTWYTIHSWGNDNAYTDEMAAHELGHLMSLFDEYTGGAVNPDTQLVNTGGLMHNFGPTLDYYYEPFLDWYEAKLDSVSTVPEPTTMLLFGTGLIILTGFGRRKQS